MSRYPTSFDTPLSKCCFKSGQANAKACWIYRISSIMENVVSFEPKLTFFHLCNAVTLSGSLSALKNKLSTTLVPNFEVDCTTKWRYGLVGVEEQIWWTHVDLDENQTIFNISELVFHFKSWKPKRVSLPVGFASFPEAPTAQKLSKTKYIFHYRWNPLNVNILFTLKWPAP